MRLIEWKPGKADAPWKVAICARDASRADEILLSLDSILTRGDRAAKNGDEAAERLRQLTSEQIIDGLLHYRDVSIETVKRGLNGG